LSLYQLKAVVEILGTMIGLALDQLEAAVATLRAMIGYTTWKV